MMRFHVVALPHAQTTREFSSCAFTADVINFCKMMMARGHEVLLYAGDQNSAPCTEHIACFTEPERVACLKGKHYTAAEWDNTLPHWMEFNRCVVEEMRPRLRPHDFICLIGGRSQKPIADAFPFHMSVEFAIGYGATFAKYRVWKSYAWMHACYGAADPKHNANAVDGQWYDAVIPGYLDLDEFPYQEMSDDYYLFVGRLIDRKGYQIAVDVCRELDVPLHMAGAGTPPEGVMYHGVVEPEERAKLMGGAKAVFMPTTYLEPFGMVAIEAMACGTPVITTDWGAFTETVKHGETGFRCRTFQEFCDAVTMIDILPRWLCRAHVVKNYSLEVVGAQYERYFKQLLTLWGDGWYTGRQKQ